MALLSWSKNYEIGHDLIDNEHEGLFRLVNAFHSAWQENNDRQFIAAVLTKLIAYAEEHFQHEEAVMAEAGYPLLETHHQIHEQMVESIFKLRQAYEKGSLQLEITTMKFVKNWLVEHILENDYQFRDFLNKQKKAALSQESTPPKLDENSENR